jgi:hypothetical protein
MFCETRPGSANELALAHVVRRILDLAGLTFDSDGRLLSGPTRDAAHHG